MSPKIRFATESDIPSLWHLEQRSFNDRAYHMLAKRQFHYLLTKGNCQIFVALIDKQLVGAIVLLFRKNSRLARLYSFAVDPFFQGKGIGNSLFHEACRYLLSKNYNGILCEARADKDHLLTFYKKLGFVALGILPNYYPDGSNAIKFKKLFTIPINTTPKQREPR